MKLKKIIFVIALFGFLSIYSMKDFEKKYAQIFNFYTALGVARDASSTKIDEVYKALNKRFEEQKKILSGVKLKNVYEAFSRATIAYNVLSDETKRIEYNKGLSKGLYTTEKYDKYAARKLRGEAQKILKELGRKKYRAFKKNVMKAAKSFNFYQLLGLKQDTDAQAIRQAYVEAINILNTNRKQLEAKIGEDAVNKMKDDLDLSFYILSQKRQRQSYNEKFKDPKSEFVGFKEEQRSIIEQINAILSKKERPEKKEEPKKPVPKKQLQKHRFLKERPYEPPQTPSFLKEMHIQRQRDVELERVATIDDAKKNKKKIHQVYDLVSAMIKDMLQKSKQKPQDQNIFARLANTLIKIKLYIDGYLKIASQVMIMDEWRLLKFNLSKAQTNINELIKQIDADVAELKNKKIISEILIKYKEQLEKIQKALSGQDLVRVD